ncbi:MAG: hypothetical protein ACI4PF_01125 [Christensenellales bacterium]
MEYNKSKVIENIKKTYSWLSDDDLEQCFNMALSDYISLRYPIQSDRPKIDDFIYDFSNSQWLYARMLDILGRAGGLSVTAYRENNLNFSYAKDYISPELKLQIVPKVSVPK